MTKHNRKRYRKRPDQYVIAIQIDLQTDGFTYRKWGAEQRCKPGDWLVDNAGEIYTVDKETFMRTYRKTGPGHYTKSTPVWAEIAETSGKIPTKEGSSDFNAGDYLVYNNQDGTDAYCMSAAEFQAMYEPDD